MLEQSVVERGVVENWWSVREECGVEKCWIGEECCREELRGSVVEECWREVL